MAADRQTLRFEGRFMALAKDSHGDTINVTYYPSSNHKDKTQPSVLRSVYRSNDKQHTGKDIIYDTVCAEIADKATPAVISAKNITVCGYAVWSTLGKSQETPRPRHHQRPPVSQATAAGATTLTKKAVNGENQDVQGTLMNYKVPMTSQDLLDLKQLEASKHINKDISVGPVQIALRGSPRPEKLAAKEAEEGAQMAVREPSLRWSSTPEEYEEIRNTSWDDIISDLRSWDEMLVPHRD
ncbi:predicted protein [Pyrenophora tritici-repentis Pt-1C-BFP]|uniref:Uncharacterized protein n=1 Tax=Pyrenophora tritici-repentis (strain Pt-1C-BFP) TaxID=426418 RepID=B2WNS9_PYRTR|nr:uncharacterized protein PTRG_11639 [Pyrenophora tritici-repentis Pt-1C-BFP]EDU44689.1 predicted protein [Pyrenophora tritici-repentis Pt-1C-BFP]